MSKEYFEFFKLFNVPNPTHLLRNYTTDQIKTWKSRQFQSTKRHQIKVIETSIVSRDL